jgi:endogenous inhibitor of DNA gyrase (YacG/DUF329 family)
VSEDLPPASPPPSPVPSSGLPAPSLAGPSPGPGKEAPTAPCPTCEKPASLGDDNPARPFCTSRCKWVDLGRWLDGSYRVPAEDEDEPPAAAPQSHDAADPYPS